MKAVTLLELLIALVLVGAIVMGFNSIDLFSRYHVLTSERRAKVQNEASVALEHMTKQITRAIGNTQIDGISSIIDNTTGVGGDYALLVYIDDGDPADGKRDAASDHWIAYAFKSAGGPTDPYNIWYYSNCGTDKTCISVPETIAYKITSFSAGITGDCLNGSCVKVNITACWDPLKTQTQADCGTPDNPSVNMQAQVNMPSVSTN